MRDRLFKGISEPLPYIAMKSLEILRSLSYGSDPRPRLIPFTVLYCSEDELKKPLLAKEISPKPFFGSLLTPESWKRRVGSTALLLATELKNCSEGEFCGGLETYLRF